MPELKRQTLMGKKRAAVAVKALREIRKKEGGVLTSKMVLEYARDPDHPLHNFFEWDDSLAAERYRLEQAGHLVRHLYAVVVMKDSKKPEALPVRVYMHVKKNGERQYVPYDEIAEAPDLADQVLENTKRDLENIMARYAAYKRLFSAKFKKSIEGSIQEIRKLIRQKKTPAPSTVQA